MFWKDAKGFSGLPASSKIGLTAFLLIAGIGYIFGFFNIFITYSPIDQEAGLSIKDVQIAFWGAREATKLEKAIDGNMKEHFAGDNEHKQVKDWVTAGAKEEEFEPVKAIFAVSCSTCHSAEAQVAGVVTVNYEDISQYLKRDTGKSISRLVSISHTHVLALLPIIFILCLIFSYSLFAEKLKLIVIAFSFLSIIFDVGSWWLAKLSGALAPLVILGGVALAISFLALILLSLYDVWLRKPTG